MNNMSGIEYLCVDIANNFGLDKEVFADRIKWVKDNFNNLEELADQATEDKVLYIKSVMALRDVCAGKPTGHLISLDATCSGMQVLSALTGCIKGAIITNLTPEPKRYDAYTEVTAEQNNVLLEWQVTGLEISRKDAKDAVMTSLYGSKATPKKIFGEDGPAIEAFYEAAMRSAPGAFGLLNKLLNAWQPWALSHYWKMPDGFDVAVKVMQTEETRIEVDELNHHKFKTSYKVNMGSKSGISLPANVTHSVDAYVLRTLLRKCSYHAPTLNKCKAMLTEFMDSPVTECESPLLGMYYSTGLVDPVWFETMDKEVAQSIPKELKVKLLDMIEDITQFKPFPVLTVHDAFRIHSNNGDALRYHYRNILADLADSTLLDHILTMITGKKFKYKKLSNNLSQLIRESVYGVC